MAGPIHPASGSTRKMRIAWPPGARCGKSVVDDDVDWRKKTYGMNHPALRQPASNLSGGPKNGSTGRGLRKEGVYRLSFYGGASLTKLLSFCTQSRTSFVLLCFTTSLPGN